MSVQNPICPEGCDFQLPSLSFDFCSPEVSFGEITHIYLAAGDAAPFTDVESLQEWTARVSDNSVDANAIRDLAVVADLPAASAEEIVISLNRKIFSPAEHVINVEIDDVSPETYEFARSTSCNTGYRMWFSTPEHIYGGTDGILAMVNLRPQIERGAQSVNKLVGTITWSAKFSAERNINPYAA